MLEKNKKSFVLSGWRFCSILFGVTTKKFYLCPIYESGNARVCVCAYFLLTSWEFLFTCCRGEKLYTWGRINFKRAAENLSLAPGKKKQLMRAAKERVRDAVCGMCRVSLAALYCMCVCVCVSRQYQPVGWRWGCVSSLGFQENRIEPAHTHTQTHPLTDTHTHRERDPGYWVCVLPSQSSLLLG